MNEFERELNVLLVDTFKTILKVEEQMIQDNKEVKLTISELHMLETIGSGGNPGRTISDISVALEVSLPAVTVAVNKLVAKGLLQKEKSSMDGRSVFIFLTEKGAQMSSHHTTFHKCMVEDASKGMTEEEQAVLLTGVKKLNRFFKKKSRQMED